MASRKKKKAGKPRGRSTESYLHSADNLSKIVPSLKKFAKRKTLKKSEKATIRRREKQLLYPVNLVPLTRAQAKRAKRRKLFAPGVQAIQLRGVDIRAGDKVKITRSGEIDVTKASGDRWIYWSLDKQTVRSKRGMKKAGQAVFEKTLPIEKVTELTEAAFKRYTIKEVHLWAHAGVVGEAMEDLGAFVNWVNKKWIKGEYHAVHLTKKGRYEVISDPGDWILGIAFLVENPEYTEKRKQIDAETKANKTVVKPKRSARKI